MSDATALLGRDELLGHCRAGLADGGGVLLTGPAGIGKSAVLDALDAEASQAGTLVLRSNSSAVEASLPYLALYDLFAQPVAERDGLLAPHLRAVLDVVLLRSPADGAATDQLAIRVAVLELLRALAADRPVLLVLDDAHCLDPASALVLGFAARRLQHHRTQSRLPGHRVQFAAAERLAEGREPRCLGLLPEPRTELAVSTLPGPVIGELLRTRLDLAPTDRISERIQTASGGNPYYALELAQSALRSRTPVQTDEPLPVPDHLRALLADRLAALPGPALGPLLLAAAAARPDRRLLAAADPGAEPEPGADATPPTSPTQSAPSAPSEVLATAIAAGVLSEGPGGELRFAHPLLREIIYADATPEHRRSCHATLARLLDDPLERARHRALADTGSPTVGEPAELAQELADAARIAVSRGAPGLAAELSQLAAERSSHQPELAAERQLAAARHAYDAGLAEQARAACETVLRGPSRAARVGARLLLVELAGGDRAGVPALLDAAEADAADDQRLRADVQLHRANQSFSTGRIEQGLTALAEAERHAELSRDVDRQIEVIALRAPIQMQYGQAPHHQQHQQQTQQHRVRHSPAEAGRELRRAAELAAGRPALTAAAVQVRCCLVIWLLRCGETAEAVQAVTALRRDVEHAGRVKDLADVLHLVASVHERAGLCAQAHQAGELGGRMRAEFGATQGPALVLSAAAELNGGTAERAAELAGAALSAGERTGDTEWTGYAHGLLGRAELLLGRLPQAAEHLGSCRDSLRGLGFTDPALFLVDADLVEALARTGAAERAEAVLAEAAGEAQRLDRRVVRLGLARGGALLRGLAGDPRGAADALRAALPAAHPYPLELARARLTLGELERRARRRAAARTELRTAAGLFATAQCLPWLRHARGQLARLDSPTAALSEPERQIVELVEQGATNRQIAAALHVSVKAVEGCLTRLYRRYGIRDRTQLTLRRIAG
ncbi:helix-turn-helix transcriptional regulator [Kitasatospora sp. MMS16-BH015]|uniref:helix-turn-helix transcriptional regulator n=1 Tax=Kitasatospora sp. MMS16-BH015 TaxID=2018025 RepID=UPI000CA217AE|nr:LuxR family transcriptional regulator [Kitasatospora sp. MMS16-BH015]AUG78275.1 helix-turn-helix transcriptional regulator [Kitasatospora sp. MMS16-BH015]